MRIVHAQLFPLQIPLRASIKMAGETISHAHTLLLRLTDEQGRQGWGEASAAPLMTGETLESLTASTAYLVSRSMASSVRSPRDIASVQERVLYGNSSAKSCHATALLDLMAQRASLPLHGFLKRDNAHVSAPLPILHMLAADDLDAECEQAYRLRAQGIRHWKIKVGVGPLEVDLHRVKVLCELLQGDTISADANTVLSIESARAIARLGVECGLTFLEQPFPVGSISDMAQLYRETGLPLCADESIQGLRDVEEHHTLAAAQGVSLKLIKFGGPSAMLAAGDRCLALGMKLNLACKVAETTISAAATAHTGLALGGAAWGFSMSNRYLEQDICPIPLTAGQGAIQADQLEQAGLGFSADPDLIAEFVVPAALSNYVLSANR